MNGVIKMGIKKSDPIYKKCKVEKSVLNLETGDIKLYNKTGKMIAILTMPMLNKIWGKFAIGVLEYYHGDATKADIERLTNFKNIDQD